MPKPPPVGSPRLKYQGIFELTDDVVDLVVAEVDDRAQQAPIKLAADDGGRLHHRNHLRAGAQPGEQRFIQRLGHPGLTDSVDDLFDIERHTVATRRHRRPLVRAQSRIQRGDQLIGLNVGQRRQVKRLVRPCLPRPLSRPSCHDDHQVALGRREQHAEHFEGGWIKPVHILGDYQARFAAQACQQIGVHRLCDQLVESSALGGHRLIAGLCLDTQHRGQQRYGALRIQAAGANLVVQQL
jgi:hypothetical protein